ncbi:hypothetical protein O181_003361 [Austropuccinia psidii MF-1]|uniref:Uncharacterized protein n=1 Tax=Austropuccinia psidii MF-1 TaxID=1389203 RepID=A0A9Q3GE34_9BASI|nr:hypothetical protein [Austropuccinia psidii MF-1]
MGRSGNKNPEYLSQEMAWIDLMKEIKGWNPNKNYKLLEERETRIKDNQPAIQAIEKSLYMEDPSQIQVPKDMEEEVPSSPKQSRSSRPYKPRETSSKAHQSSLVVSRRRQGDQGKNKTSFSQRKQEADPLMKKLMYLAQEVHKRKK